MVHARFRRVVLPFLVAAGCLLVPSRVWAQVSDWTMSGQNAQHTGFSPNLGPEAPDLEWVSGGGAGPVVLGGDALYGVGDGLQAFDFDGRLKWRLPVSVLHTPAVGPDGTVYASGYSGTVYAIDPSDPEVEQYGSYLLNGVAWTYTTGGQISGSPTIAPDGSILVTSSDKYLYHLEPGGTLRRRLAPSGSAKFTGTVAVGPDGTILARATDNSVYAYTFAGVLKWKYRASATPNDLVVGDNGIVYFTTVDFTLWAINANGTKRFSVAIGTKPKGDSSICWNQPAIDPVASTLCVGGRDALYGYSLTGAQKWKVTTPGMVGHFSRPAIGNDGIVYFSRGDTWNFSVVANVYAANTGNGALLTGWPRSIGSWLPGDPVIDTDGSLYVGGASVYRFQDGGSERPTITRFDIGPDDVVYEGDELDLRSHQVRDTDGTISKVEYFIDDGDGQFDPGLDLKIGESTAPAVVGGTSYRLYFTPPGPGDYRFFSVATDNSGQPSNVVSGVATVLPAP